MGEEEILALVNRRGAPVLREEVAEPSLGEMLDDILARKLERAVLESLPANSVGGGGVKNYDKPLGLRRKKRRRG